MFCDFEGCNSSSRGFVYGFCLQCMGKTVVVLEQGENAHVLFGNKQINAKTNLQTPFYKLVL